MPYKRSYARRPRRTWRRKRAIFKKKRFFKRKSIYTDVVHTKITEVLDLTFSTALSSATGVVRWGTPRTFGDGTVGPFGTAKFNQFLTMYDQYKINYLSMKVDLLNSNATAYEWYDLKVASDPNQLLSIVASEDDLRAKVDFHQYPVRSGARYTKGLSIHKAAKRQGTASSTSQGNWMKSTNYNYVAGGTLWRLGMTGPSNGHVVGKVICTYYVSFKDLKAVT